MAKRYTIEVDDVDHLPDVTGEDFEYTLGRVIGEFLGEAGYETAKLTAHNGRATNRYTIDNTGTVTKLTS